MNTFRRVRSLLVVVLVGSISAARAAELRIVGSDLLGTEFTKACYVFSIREAAPLAVVFDGSRPGLDQLKTGRADLALLTLPSADEPDAAVFASVPLAWHRIVVIVPAVIPFERVTFSELAAVFGVGVAVSHNRWGDLGLTGEWAGSPITPLAPAAGLGLTSEYFRHAVLGDGALKSQGGRYASVADLLQRLAGDSRAIALAASLPTGATGLKLLSVAPRSGDPAFSPTPENLHSGDYPLRLPLRIVFRHEATAKLLPLLRWLLSDTAAATLERAELVSVPASLRHQQVLALEKK